MARISTYENSSPVLLTDKVIGTNVSGTPTNVTKNFLVSDLLTLFQSNITLQNVLDAGNTATQSITLTGAITQTGNFGITGNITQTGNYNPTGDITHVGGYNFSGGQFTMGATGTMVLGGALTCNSSVSLTGTVKDYTDTLGAANQFLVSDASGQVTWQSTLPSPLASSALTVINLALSNAEGVVVTTAGTATDVRVPTNAGTAFPIGTKVTIIQEGAGQVTIAPTAGVTVNSAVGLKTNAQFAVAHVVKTATDTWYAYGNLTT